MLRRILRFVRRILSLLASLLGLLWRRQTQPNSCHDSACLPVRKPDPFIYSQYYLMSLGYPVTWDNPDITIFDGTTPVDPHDLRADTIYTVAARIWNNSADTPVVNLKVTFSYLSFGAGVRSHTIGTTATDLNVRGLSGCPAFAYMPWRTPAALGHYCLQVLLEPPDDLNWLNNLGQRNTDVAHPASPATFTFAVGNRDELRPRVVTFAVDSYSIPPLPRCGSLTRGADTDRSISKDPPPVPPGWTVIITPHEVQLAPGEETTVDVAITAAAEFSGTMPFNITARNEIQPIGGVTLYVEVP